MNPSSSLLSSLVPSVMLGVGIRWGRVADG